MMSEENDIDEALEGAVQGEGSDPVQEAVDEGAAGKVAESEGYPVGEEAEAERSSADLPEREMPSIDDDDRMAQVGDFIEPDYAAILGIDEHDPIEEASPAEATPEATPAEAPSTPEEIALPPDKPEVVEEVVVAPVAEPVVTESVVEPEVEAKPEEPAAAPTPETPTAEDYNAALKAHMEKSLPILENQYALSEEEAATVNDLDSKPSEWLPKMLAKLHYNAFITSYNAAQANLPEKVTQITQQQIENEKAATEFFSDFPDLREHQQVAAQSIVAFRQLNPNASPEEIRKGSGTLAMITIGKVPVAAPVAPIVPVAPNAPPPPIQPGAGAGAVGFGGEASYEQGIFSDMVDEDRRIGN